VTELCTPAADASTRLADVARDVAARLAPLLATALVDRPASPGAAPEVLEPATRDDAVAHMLRQATRIVVHARLRARLTRVTAATMRDFHSTFRAAYRELFIDQLVVVHDAGETGDQVIDRCARAVPPGTDVSVMGIQNIKGTGLDFVYRWQALESTTARLAALAAADADAEARLAALRALESFEDYGLVDSGAAAAVLSGLDTRGWDDAERVQHERTLAAVRAVHDARRVAVGQAASKKLWSRALARLETWVDPIDSVRRYRRARRVMRDLVAHRISHARAAKEMRSLYDRQKGGWLEEALRGKATGDAT
jgi:hypothetical protein